MAAASELYGALNHCHGHHALGLGHFWRRMSEDDERRRRIVEATQPRGPENSQRPPVRFSTGRASPALR